MGVWHAENVGFERGARAALRAIARGEDVGGGRRLLTRFSRGGLGDALETVLVDVGALVSARARRGAEELVRPVRLARRLPADSAHGRRRGERRGGGDGVHPLPLTLSSGRAWAWPRGIAGARARDASRAPTLLRGTSSSQSPGSTIVPPRDRAWTRLARRFVRRRESFCAFQRGALAKPRAVWGRGWISQSAAIEKNEGLGTPQKMSVCTNV